MQLCRPSLFEGISLDEVVSISAYNPHILRFFLVDSHRRLTGVITRTELMKWAHFKLFGGKSRHEILVTEFFRIVDARQARDLTCGYGRELRVKQTDTLQKALDLMLDFKVDIIPVIYTSPM
jgi:hypothetical protein